MTLLDELRERVADPGNDHAPCFDAAVAIDALFEGSQFQEGVDVEFLRVLDVAFDGDGPGTRLETPRIFGWISFIHAEFVEIVVVGDVLVGGRLLTGQRERALHYGELGVGAHSGCRRKQACNAFAGHCRGSRSQGAGHKGAAVQVDRFRSDLRRRYVARLVYQHRAMELAPLIRLRLWFPVTVRAGKGARCFIKPKWNGGGPGLSPAASLI